METPFRVQRKRTKGFKLPPNTVCVTRGTKYGNPFPVDGKIPEEWCDKLDKEDTFHYLKWNCGYVDDSESAVLLFEKYVLPKLDVSELRGKNIACFCSLMKPCHGDSILEKANQ